MLLSYRRHHFKDEDLMQITGAGSARIRPQNNRVIVIRNNTPSLFSRELAKKEETILGLEGIELEDLREELKDAGDCFEAEPNLANFRIFREMIGRFAKKAISLAYRIDRMKGSRSNRIIEYVSIIDRNADGMPPKWAPCFMHTDSGFNNEVFFERRLHPSRLLL
jgi:uncharacterized protein YaaR (DUF327 family)